MTQDKYNANNPNDIQISQWVSKQYKESQQQEPAKEVDQHILELAKSKLENSKTKISVKTRTAWMFPTSMAASIMIVAVIYLGTTDYFSQSVPVEELTVSQPTFSSQPAQSKMEPIKQAEVSKLERMEIQNEIAHERSEVERKQRMQSEKRGDMASFASNTANLNAQNDNIDGEQKIQQFVNSMLDIQNQLNLTHQQLIQKADIEIEQSAAVEKYHSLYQELVNELKGEDRKNSEQTLDEQINALLKQARQKQKLLSDPDY